MRVGGLALACVLAACDDQPPPLSSFDVGACDGRVTILPDEGGPHLPLGTPIEWSSNPPATGAHYPQWTRWDRHYTALDRRYWLHNAEHGGIVLLYNCPAGCPDVVDALLAVVRARPTDPSCQAPVRNRMLVVADPELPDGVQVAAVAWNVTYTAGCVDPYLGTFATERYNHAPEDFCFEGVELGGEFIAP